MHPGKFPLKSAQAHADVTVRRPGENMRADRRDNMLEQHKGMKEAGREREGEGGQGG